MEGLHIGDVRDILPTLPAESVNCIVTSPPYWGLRDYGVDGQIGLEDTPQAWVDEMVGIFRECRRVLRKDGTCWVNVGDAYAQNGASKGATSPPSSKTYDHGGWEKRASKAGQTAVDGLKPKDLCLMPFRLALALQSDGWYVRSHIIWAKKSPMPESVTDRPTSAHESIFLLTRSARYWYDADAVREPYADKTLTTFSGNCKAAGAQADGTGLVASENWANSTTVRAPHESGKANLRNVWHLGPEPFAEAHFATFPTEIPKRCILAGCPGRVCVVCGEPWRKDVTTSPMEIKRSDYAAQTGNRTVTSGTMTKPPQRMVNGEFASCNCGPPPDDVLWKQKHARDVPGIVLDPFMGAGTTAKVAQELGRRWVGIELNPEYAEMAERRAGQYGMAI